jgi:ubiquinone/menaquinone biosynthesis C-methylase UbiE
MIDAVAVKNSEIDAFNDVNAFLSWEEGCYWSRIQQIVIKKLNCGLNSAKSVLEVGCGKSVYLQMVNQENSIAVGVDISKSLLKLNENSERVLGDGENLSFAPKSFDYVFCVGSIHHMPNKNAAITEIAKVCKKNLFIIEPHSMSSNWFYWAARQTVLHIFGYERVKKLAGFVAPHETFVSKNNIEKNLPDFRVKFHFYSPFRAPPLKALSKIDFEPINVFLEKIPGIRRMGTYIVAEAERIEVAKSC